MSSSRGCQAALRFSPALFEAEPERQTDLIFLLWQFSKSGLKIETKQPRWRLKKYTEMCMKTKTCQKTPGIPVMKNEFYSSV